MKKLIIILLPVLLTACVRYYTPETAIEDGVYYAEDDPSYVFNSGDFTGVVYYPWSSLDYFYLGYWPYPGHGYGFAHAYPYGLGYSPWYVSYHYYPYWRPYRGYCPHYGSCGRYSHDGGHDRYARKGGNRRRHAGDDEDLLEQENEVGSDGASSGSRYVSTAPAGYAGKQGMVIRNRESTKIGQSQVEPVKAAPSPSVSVVPSPANTSTRSPARSTRSSFSRSSSRSSSFRSPSRSHSSRASKSSNRRDRD